MENKQQSLEKEESKSWNISKDYVHELVLKKLLEIDKYRDLAIFGFSTLENELLINKPNLRASARLGALNRLINSMNSLIYFSNFSLKEKDHKEKFEKYLLRLQKIKDNLWQLRDDKTRENKVTHLNIHEELFLKIINELSEIADNLIRILNKSGIIFARHEKKNLAESVIEM